MVGGNEWLSGAELDGFRALALRRHFPARATLFVEGDDPYDVMLIESGDVKLTTMSLAGGELVLDVVGAGGLLGDLSALDGGQRSATAVALTAVEVTSMSAGTFREFLHGSTDATHAMLRSTVTRLRQAYRRELEYSRQDSLGRVCARLDELARRSASASPATDNSNGRITLVLTQTELAQWCGLSREAVVKALRKLRSDHWITSNNATITIVEPLRVRERGAI